MLYEASTCLTSETSRTPLQNPVIIPFFRSGN
jgi:hypothetical protein